MKNQFTLAFALTAVLASGCSSRPEESPKHTVGDVLAVMATNPDQAKGMCSPDVYEALLALSQDDGTEASLAKIKTTVAKIHDTNIKAQLEKRLNLSGESQNVVTAQQAYNEASKSGNGEYVAWLIKAKDLDDAVSSKSSELAKARFGVESSESQSSLLASIEANRRQFDFTLGVIAREGMTSGLPMTIQRSSFKDLHVVKNEAFAGAKAEVQKASGDFKEEVKAKIEDIKL